MPNALLQRLRSALLLGVASAVLASCGGGKDKADATAILDAPLTTNIVDPAVREAVEAPIASDPYLLAESNQEAIRPSDRPLTGTLPVIAPSTNEAKAQALRLAGGKLIAPPATSRSIASTGDTPITLIGLVRQSSARAGGGKAARCDRDTGSYAMEWAQRLPAALPLYPRAHLREAAGADGGGCAFRAVSFTTAVPLGEVMNFYATMAKRAGYSIEQIEQNGAPALVGTQAKSGAAYHIRFRAMAGGGTMADLIVTGDPMATEDKASPRERGEKEGQ